MSIVVSFAITALAREKTNQTIQDGRAGINKGVQRIKRMFRWGDCEGTRAPSVCHGLQAVDVLRRGRSNEVAAMIHMQELTGVRPGEFVIMRTCDLDTNGRIWAYKPERQKPQYHGHERAGGRRSGTQLGAAATTEGAALAKPRQVSDQEAKKGTETRGRYRYDVDT
jgi:hypothetical protein